ncbi:hypothetical protein PA3071 [hydrothermal vent metagenome]|uniref:DUF58 domain-containing protein n=1 Tax=hydrothermal vent metagenome TaxID=652676 RepID=A0A1W1EE32_9ZZZZ
MDFSEMKQYVQGDDTRNMDWKATRRTGKPYVRIYNEERDRNVWLVISQMNSMFFGSKERMKSVSAAHTAALFAFKALETGDRVGAVVYNNDEVKFFKASSSKNNIVNIMTEIERQNNLLEAHNADFSKGNLGASLKILSSLAKHDDLVVLIGDGRAMDEESAKHITRINAHNDVIAVMVYDPMEEQIVPSSSLFLTDGVETVDLDSRESHFLEKYRALLNNRKEDFKNLSRKNALPLLSISTERAVLEQLYEQLSLHRERE